jgi:competence protein ComGC
MKNNLKAFTLGVSLSMMLIGAYALALSIPNLFNAGEPINASKMNANFTAVKTAVDALEQKVSKLESSTKGPTDKGVIRAFVTASGAGAINNQYNSTGGNITISNDATGKYQVSIPGVNYNFREWATVINATSDNDTYCKAQSNDNNKVAVGCYNLTDGSSQNSSFTMIVLNK